MACHLSNPKISKLLLSLLLLTWSTCFLQAQNPAAPDKLVQLATDLIAAKGNINQCYDSRYNKSDSGIPILIWAVNTQNLAVVELLLKNGADANIETMKGSSETGLFEVAVSVEAEPDPKKREERCSLTKKICEALIKAKANVNYKNKLGASPLHKAAMRGRHDLCALLIANGAEINAQDRMGASPLHQAAKYGHWETVELLMKNKAALDLKNKLGKTPLQLATERSEEKTQKEMRDKFGSGYYAGADYDKTIQALTKTGAK